MSKTGNEHFTQAMNRVKDTCVRNGEIIGNENIYNINAYWQAAQLKLNSARSMKNRLLGEYPQAEAAANWINNTFVKWGENACKLIADALPTFRETGEFKIPDPNTPPTRIVAKNIDARAPDTQRNPGIRWYASNQKLERDMRANGL